MDRKGDKWEGVNTGHVGTESEQYDVRKCFPMNFNILVMKNKIEISFQNQSNPMFFYWEIQTHNVKVGLAS